MKKSTIKVCLLLITAMFSIASISHAGTTEIVSVDSYGNQGNEVSAMPSISADGRFVAFTSYASNLVPGDTNGIPDVFVHDRQTGVTERVSVDSYGNQAYSGAYGSFGPSISADGRFVAFTSHASNLVPGDTNGGPNYFDTTPDIFVHDRQTGITERVSVDSSGNQANGGSWSMPSISGDGRYVAFTTWASNLVPGDTNGLHDIFVHDRQTGVTERVSVDSSGNQANNFSDWPTISVDGRYVAFTSLASNLVFDDTNGIVDVFVHDRQTGVTERVSVDSNGNQETVGINWYMYTPVSISNNGRYVAFTLYASDAQVSDVFVHDRQTGITERVSVDNYGNQGNALSESPFISADSRYVAFTSLASNLVPGDTNGTWDIFMYDRQTGLTERVSVDSYGNQGDYGSRCQPSLSGDSKYVAFYSQANNLVPGDTNGAYDVFVRDRVGNTIPPDITPPTVTVTATPSILWPPNHKMVDVTIDGSASDDTSGIVFIEITVTDEYGIYNMTVPGFGSIIQLEAWREGTDRDGRVYTITVVATDMAGNKSTTTTQVTVPHDLRK